MINATRRGGPPSVRDAVRRTVSATLTAHFANLGYREQLRRELAAAGYPADTVIDELTAGRPMQAVLRKHGFDGRRHPAAGLSLSDCQFPVSRSKQSLSAAGISPQLFGLYSVGPGGSVRGEPAFFHAS